MIFLSQKLYYMAYVFGISVCLLISTISGTNTQANNIYWLIGATSVTMDILEMTVLRRMDFDITKNHHKNYIFKITAYMK